jgi:hypothetical protein
MIKSFFNANNVGEINAIYMTKEFQNVIAGNKEIIVYIPTAKEFLLINFTRGENLLPEDIESEMTDSAYIRVLSINEDNCIFESEAAEMVFNDEKSDYYTNVKHLCTECMKMAGYFAGLNYIIAGIFDVPVS